MRHVLIFLILSSTLYAVDCKRNKIYCQILNNFKTAKKLKLVSKTYKVNKKKMFKISNIIYKIAKRYKIDARLYTAILMQESKYDLGAKNCTSGITELSHEEIAEKKSKCIEKFKTVDGMFLNPLQDGDFVLIDRCVNGVKRFKKVKICFDFGMSQINYTTANRYDFDIEQLTTDLEYSIESGAIVLRDFQRGYKKREPIDWWTRYNSPTRSNRRIYEEHVKRWM
ncbi:MAG: transglycosylase SLT domain-containing protein [Candidatus Lokiarchaeota archaeon]|nr:transglycosylase SLT domain-containing protein [Candidatus Lokiarchaeota archaeon]